MVGEACDVISRRQRQTAALPRPLVVGKVSLGLVRTE
jgi:hypothetical protein